MQVDDLSPSLIRAAQLDDIAPLTELLASSFYDRTGWTSWLYPIIRLGIQEDLKQRLKTDKPHYACLTAWVAPMCSASAAIAPSSHVAGTVEVSLRQSWPWQGLSPKYAYLSNLAVAETYRRRGIAAKLLDASEALARSWQLTDLYLHVMEDNFTARRLYRRFGFELYHAEDTTATWLGLQPRRLLLHKPLGPAQPNRIYREIKTP